MNRPEDETPSPFDRLADSWDDDPARLRRAAAIGAAIMERTPAGGTWLDYGAGTGALGLALLNHVDRLVLADSSEGMVAASQAKIAAAALQDRVRAIRVDLAAGDTIPDRFNGVASLLALHHIADAANAIARLAGLLLPGGWLALADLDAEDGSFHRHGHSNDAHRPSPAHHGFQRTDIAEWLAAAKLTEVSFSTPWREQADGRDYPIFLALGRLPR